MGICIRKRDRKNVRGQKQNYFIGKHVLLLYGINASGIHSFDRYSIWAFYGPGIGLALRMQWRVT